jgi:hypothetical protein
MGRFERAYRALTQAVELSTAGEGGELPDRAYLLLARMEMAAGRAQQSADWLSRFDPAVSRDPYVLFWSAELIGSRERMRALLEQYIGLAPKGHEDWVEASRGRLRLDNALGDRPIWQAETLPERMSLPLRLSWDDRGRLLGYVIEVQIGEGKKPVKKDRAKAGHRVALR